MNSGSSFVEWSQGGAEKYHLGEDDDFQCMVALAPDEMDAAAAAIRAGGKVVLDFGTASTREDIQAVAGRLQERLAPKKLASEDLLLRVNSLSLARDLAEDTLGNTQFGIVAACPPESLTEIEELAKVCALFAESGDVATLSRLAALTDLAGIVAVGEEAGGWTGALSSLLLAREMSRIGETCSDMPDWFLRGAVGPGAAAAAAIAGATGVFLDDATLLMPERGRTSAEQRFLETLDGTETAVIGGPLNKGLRLLIHPRLPASRDLEKEAARIEATASDENDAEERWAAAGNRSISDPGQMCIGQGIGLARLLRDRHGRLARLVATVRDTRLHLGSVTGDLAAQLSYESPLAKGNGTEYPVVQGPMTRVSDQPAFARAVAEGGGLPMIALAMLSPRDSRDLLQQTAETLGDRPWGAGILGFLPPDQLEPQLAELLAVKPRFCVIAGGRADLAKRIENSGIVPYVHAPTPGLARGLVDRGVHHLVLEGRECGGHVGPLHSSALWESVALDLAGHPDAGKLRVLLAGGIHDAMTAAMALAVAVPLIEAGAQVGVLMGTAYLATEEAVACQAITSSYQQAVVGSTGTANLESGRGHANRCLATPFVGMFNQSRRELLATDESPDRIREALDDLLLGRLRLASKGLTRKAGRLTEADADTQFSEGMFMAGEAAGLIHDVQSIAALHRNVCLGGAEVLAMQDRPARPQVPAGACDVAIVGMAMHLPGATDPDAFWRNLLDKRSAVREVPESYWDWRLFQKGAVPDADAIACKWGGFVDPLEFDPIRFGIPPTSVPNIAPAQLMALEVVRRAIADAGYESRPFDRENTATIFASEEAGGYFGNELVVRSIAPLLLDEDATDALRQRTSGWTGDSFPGILTSVVAGRVANRFDFGGANFTVDSACASGITALSLAVAELTSGRANVAILAGCDTNQTPYHFTAFSSVTALSSSGQLRSFDEAGDGTVLSEGVAAFMLKRREDAERDGDRIYAVIRATAASSDGRGLGLTAPRPKGQKRALKRAYDALGAPISTIGLYEAHGTGTPVGDRAELESLRDMIADTETPSRVAIGSHKALLGHTKTAAGVVGLGKAALALFHRTIPPQPGIERPLAPLGTEDAPVYITDGPTPWFRGDTPRRAGVSAFGFGGTNGHAVVEEYDPKRSGHMGAGRWPVHLIPASGRSKAALAGELRALVAAAHPRADLAEIARAACGRADPDAPFAGWAVAESIQTLAGQLAAMLARLADEDAELPANCGVGSRAESGARPVAFLFPGQASQRVQMLREVAVYFDGMRDSIEAADEISLGRLPERLSNLIYPGAAFDAATRKRQLARLTDTRVAQIALGAIEAGVLATLRSLGVRPDAATGHSYGEYVALHASGVLDRDTLFDLSMVRGEAMARAPEGSMCAVAAERRSIEAVLVDHPEVVIANVNSNRQAVISGATKAVENAVKALESAGLACKMLSVGGAFHSPLMQEAARPLGVAIDGARIGAPKFPVFGKEGHSWPEDAEGIRDQLKAQLTAPVDWMAQVRGLYDGGCRVFVECGPGGVLSHLSRSILDGCDAQILTIDDGSGIQSLLSVLGTLWMQGQHIHLERAAPQGTRPRSLEQIAADGNRAIAPTTWLIDGMNAVPAAPDSPFKAPQRKRLTLETRAAASATRRAETQPQQTEQPPAVSSEGDSMSVAHDPLFAAYSDYQETMRRFLQTQEAVMQQLLAGGAAVPVSAIPPRTDSPQAAQPVEAAQVTPAAVPPAAAQTIRSEPVTPAATVAAAKVPAPAPEAALDQAGAESLLLGIVSERTGYPEAMIALDQDIEAELGIDSIKRLEIVDRILSEVPKPVAERLRETAETVAREKQLSGWVSAILVAQNAKEAVAPVSNARPNQAGTTDVSSRTSAGCPAYVMAATAAPLPQLPAARIDGHYLLIQGPHELNGSVVDLLERLGASAVTTLETGAGLPAMLEIAEAARDYHGPVRGILNLSPLRGPDTSDWATRSDADLKSLCRLTTLFLKDLSADGPAPARVFSLARLGGAFGRDLAGGQAPADLMAALGGGAAGFLSTLQIEQPEISARVIDFPAETPADAILEILEREIALERGRVEVGYPDLQRHVFEAVSQALPEPLAQAINPGGPILALGGMRGITAEFLSALATPGTPLIVVGRSAVPSAEPESLSGCPDLPSLRKVLAEETLASGSGLRPAEIEARARAVLRDRSVRETISKLEAAGYRVDCRACDMRDPAAVSALVDAVTEVHGPIATLIHGAGVIEDRLIGDKTADSFDRVVDTKIASLSVLLQHPRFATLGRVVFFASVAGRFGNRGQGDYAAANEVLNRAALWLKGARPELDVLSLNWGPWSGTGMASEAVNAQFRARNIIPIEPDAGVEFGRAALAAGGPTELIAGAGDWNRDLVEEALPEAGRQIGGA